MEYMEAMMDRQIEGAISENDRLREVNDDLIAALESVEREHELLFLMKKCESKRSRGSFGIAVMNDDHALEWQVHSSNLEKLIEVRLAVIRRAKGESK